ncbi:hypothetical protein AB0J71_31820 [Nonomuraea sp. NPDC049637]|uniref:hypothetical protein n=1 Tax=Nonomuraea sp. NPDC049637 TaxID=3154356 RepID=UPI0034161477
MAETFYGPIQVCRELGLEQWQLDRAVEAGLITNRDGRGWPAAVVEEARTRLPEIVAGIGGVPDVGAHRAAKALADRFPDVNITADTISELARQGLLPVVGDYKGHDLFCGRTLETFSDQAAVEAATRQGKLRTTDDVASYLKVRRSDVDHLVRAGLLAPAERVRGPWDSRSRASVCLYRTGDLDALLAAPEIDWDAVRAAAPGARSPLASLTSTHPGPGCGCPDCSERTYLDQAERQAAAEVAEVLDLPAGRSSELMLGGEL